MTREDVWASIDTVIQATIMLAGVWYLVNL
jgi:hypothetical protein